MDMFQKIGAAFRRFMAGRYGSDKLNTAILLAACVGLLIGWLGGKYLTSWLSLFTYAADGLLIWSIFRMYSRNIEARRRENTRWLNFLSRVKDKNNRYFRCPKCRQMVRVPRGKGSINIRCPKCSERFIRKT